MRAQILLMDGAQGGGEDIFFFFWQRLELFSVLDCFIRHFVRSATQNPTCDVLTTSVTLTAVIFRVITAVSSRDDVI